jgi:hypothetical protein
MQFNEFKKKFQSNFERVTNDQNFLFAVDVDRDTLWETYLESFRPEDNQIFRKRREFDCSCCRSFIKQVGNVVTIKDNQIVTIWDFDVDGTKFEPVVKALDNLVKSSIIRDVSVTKEKAFGTDKNREMREDETVHTWEHFHIKLPKRFISRSHKTTSSLMAEYKGAQGVFKRSLEELSKDSIETVLDLIDENSLYKGQEWESVLQQFLSLHNEYHNLTDEQKDNFCWSKSTELGGAISRIRNHSIGVLLQDITSGMNVLEAKNKYEKIVDPIRYKRVQKKIQSELEVKRAEQFVIDHGLKDSLGRRHAVLPDITINNVLWANRDAQRPNGHLGVFDVLRQEVSVKPKTYERVQGVDIKSFISEILPNATSIEVLLENRHEKNLMSLISPMVADSPTMFKWENGFSWAYNGNITDRSMKERVKAAGGKIDGVLRFSLQWNTENDNPNDYDAHCIEPNGNHIWYQKKGRKQPSSGMLDVDIINPGRRIAVENIAWTNLRMMQEGFYDFFVLNYSHNGGRSGFDAEIEYGGQIYEFAYHKDLRHKGKVNIAKVQFDRRNGFKIIESLPTTVSTKKVWNLQTNQFHPVSTVMFSPNYWDGQGVGNRHYFLMLADCINDTQPNGFFNEYLRQDFMEHRRVFEALGSKMKVEPSDSQLSGLGFSSTRRDWLIVKVDGKPMKVVF